MFHHLILLLRDLDEVAIQELQFALSLVSGLLMDRLVKLLTSIALVKAMDEIDITNNILEGRIDHQATHEASLLFENACEIAVQWTHELLILNSLPDLRQVAFDDLDDVFLALVAPVVLDDQALLFYMVNDCVRALLTRVAIKTQMLHDSVKVVLYPLLLHFE